VKLLGGRQVRRDEWKLPADDIAYAIGIGDTLKREGNEPLMWRDMVKRYMGITGDDVPATLAEAFSEQVQKLRDSRFDIRDGLQVLGYELVFCDNDGDAVIATGSRRKAEGLANRETTTGAVDNRAQIRMGLGKVAIGIHHSRQAGLLDDERERAARRIVDSLRSAVEPEEKPNTPAAPELVP